MGEKNNDIDTEIEKITAKFKLIGIRIKLEKKDKYIRVTDIKGINEEIIYTVNCGRILNGNISVNGWGYDDNIKLNISGLNLDLQDSYSREMLLKGLMSGRVEMDNHTFDELVGKVINDNGQVSVVDMNKELRLYADIMFEKEKRRSKGQVSSRTTLLYDDIVVETIGMGMFNGRRRRVNNDRLSEVIRVFDEICMVPCDENVGDYDRKIWLLGDKWEKFKREREDGEVSVVQNRFNELNKVGLK